MNAVWLDRAGLIISGLAAISFLPAVIGERRLRSFADMVRRFHMTAHSWLMRLLSYSHAPIILSPVILAILILIVISDSPSKRLLIVGGITTLCLYTLASALIHIDECSNSTDAVKIFRKKRLYAGSYVVFCGIITVAMLLWYLTPLGIVLKYVVVLAVTFALGYVNAKIALKAESAPRLARVLDFSYERLVRPIVLLPAQAIWAILRSCIIQCSRVAFGGLLWFSHSRNMQVFALIAFLTGVALQLWATFR